MIITSLAIAGGTMLVMAVILSFILGWANKKFKVEVDPKIESVLEVLPGVNCGGCGYLGCSDYAVAVVMDNDPVNKCTVGGEACAKAVAGIMGVEAGDIVKVFALVHCGAHTDDRLKSTAYRGEKRCTAAHQVAGVQGCTFGCLGFGDCVRACNYDAMHIRDGLATVNYNNCIGCGACEKVCPRAIIAITGFREDRIPAVTCSNRDKAKDSKSVCRRACVACRACVKKSDMFTVTDNLSRYDYAGYSEEHRESAAEALEKCPTKCIHFIGKPD
ncbi:MAG: RnfABCDGE type electron transport complex subunit B [Desulfobacterales bacterium]|nr:RnfABCDGE type electron transport complex subunit B [Desulfobacterales bacterium]